MPPVFRVYAYRLANAAWCGRLLSVAASCLEPTIRALPAALFFLSSLSCLNFPLSAEPSSGNGLISSSKYLWSIPEVTVLEVAPATNGTAVLLLQDREKRLALSIGASELSTGTRVPILSAKMLAASAIHLAVAADGSLWVGGTQNIRRSIGGAPLSDGYIAKLDPAGHVIREIEVARNRDNTIADIAVLPSGDAVIVGREDDASWLARISGDGEIVWEKTFGAGKIASVTVLNDLIAVVAFEAVDGHPVGAAVRVALWRFETEGRLLVDRQLVREEPAQNPSSAWLMKVVSGRGDLYAATAWTEPWSKPPSAKPLSVARITPKGQIIWQKDVPDTVVPGRLGPMPCPRTVVAPLDGGLITFCVAAEGTNLFYLERATAQITRDLLPNTVERVCDGSNGRASFMLPHSDSSILIFGTGGSCSWLQKVQLRKK
ncbi:hypothetical protein ABIF61_007523 [Bradyrhizobium japonicum]